MNVELSALIITAASIGFFHTILGPDHYLPFIMISWARKWSALKTFIVTLLCGVGHIGSSVVLGLIGVAMGIAVNKLELAESVRGNLAAWMLIAFGLAAFITAVAVSLTGLIGFVGLIVPHAVRLLTGPDHRQLLPISAIVGGAFLVLADTIARAIIAPGELPVGVITAIAGGPFFLILLAKYSRKVSWAK